MPALLDHYLDHYARRYHRTIPLLTPEVREALTAYDRPGNVRALRNAVERAVILVGDAALEPADFPLTPGPQHIAREAIVAPAADFNHDRGERRLLEEALRKPGYNLSASAMELGLSRAALCRRREKYGL